MPNKRHGWTNKSGPAQVDQHECTTGPNSRDHDRALNCLDEGPALSGTRWPWFIYPGKVAGDPRWGIIIWVASGIFSSKTSSVTSLGRPFSTRVRVAALPANEAIKWSHQHIKWRWDALPTSSFQNILARRVLLRPTTTGRPRETQNKLNLHPLWRI